MLERRGHTPSNRPVDMDHDFCVPFWKILIFLVKINCKYRIRPPLSRFPMQANVQCSVVPAVCFVCSSSSRINGRSCWKYRRERFSKAKT